MRSEPPLLEHQATLCNPAFVSKEPDGNWTVSDHRLSQHRLVRAMMRGVPRITRRTPVDDVHPGLALPVVYVYFGRARLRENEYLCCTLRASSVHNRVVLVTDAQTLCWPEGKLPRNIHIVSLAQLEKKKALPLRAFRDSYWRAGRLTPCNPWERHNHERFFILEQLMWDLHLEHVFYADGDVAVTAPIHLGMLPAGCDALVALRGIEKDAPHPLAWSVWAGSAILSRALLGDLCKFALDVFDEPYTCAMRLKAARTTAYSYMNDMVFWSMFVAASSRNAPPPLLPGTNQRAFCDAADANIDTMGVASSGRYQFEAKTIRAWDSGAPMRTLHFQGRSKDCACKRLEQSNVCQRAIDASHCHWGNGTPSWIWRYQPPLVLQRHSRILRRANRSTRDHSPGLSAHHPTLRPWGHGRKNIHDTRSQ